MGVKQAFERTVRVALSIRAGMMLDVGRSPADGVRMPGHATKRQQTETHDGMRPKTPVGQHPVIANGDADPREEIDANQQQHIAPGDQARPHQDHRRQLSRPTARARPPASRFDPNEDLSCLSVHASSPRNRLAFRDWRSRLNGPRNWELTSGIGPHVLCQRNKFWPYPGCNRPPERIPKFLAQSQLVS